MELRTRSIQAAVLGVFIISIASTTPVMGASPPVLRADLEGAPIPTYEVGSHFCHDFAYPVIHCFETSAGLERAMIGGASSSKVGSLSASGVIAAYGPNDYVTIYSGPSYAGTFAHLAQTYDSLAVIGWNDSISSFKGRNNRSGVFREHWFAGGAAYTFCCNQNVPSLPGGVDNTFSSVYRT